MVTYVTAQLPYECDAFRNISFRNVAFRNVAFRNMWRV